MVYYLFYLNAQVFLYGFKLDVGVHVGEQTVGKATGYYTTTSVILR